MANGLNIQGSGVFTYSVGSLYPQGASLASLLGFGSAGATARFGAQPAAVGVPTLNANSFIATTGKGYDTSAPDTVTKTMMVLAKWPAAQTGTTLPIGAYAGLATGDTLYFNRTSSSDLLQGIAAPASGSQVLATGASNASTIFSNASAFYLMVARYTATTMQISYVLNGVVVNGTSAALATRYTPSRTIRVGAAYDATSTGSAEIAESGFWTTVLTDAEILQMYTYYQNLKGAAITIG